MKVYSWKTLIITLLVGGIVGFTEIRDINLGYKPDYISIIFWIILIGKGLWASLTQDGYEEDELRGAIHKKVMKKYFGSWAFLASWGGIILILLGWTSLYILPSQAWLTILLLILGLVYMLVFSRIVGREIKKERKKYF